MSPNRELELALVGGGHAHLAVLKRLGGRPVPNLRVTLVARELEAPYSGMLPALVEGRVERDAAHVDLIRLARFAGARLVHAEAVGLDLEARRLRLRAGPALRFDLLSLNVGAAPRLDVEGAAEHALAVRPVDRFLARWRALVARAEADGRLRLAVVGDGVAAAELALAAKARLPGAAVALVAPEGPAARLNLRARRRLAAALARRDVRVASGARVARVEAGGVALADGRREAADAVLWATGAAPPAWLAGTGLALDAAGWIAVDESLRSLSHSFVFAAGDAAAVRGHPREKAGVFAVRQGPLLAENLRRAALGRRLRRRRPQAKALALIGTGDGRAVAARGAWAAEGRLALRLKDRIDRRWIEGYQRLS